MALDSTRLNPGQGGDAVSVDKINGVSVQIVKVAHGAEGTSTSVDAAHPLPVSNAAEAAALGAPADASATTDGGTWSVIALLKRIAAALTAIGVAQRRRGLAALPEVQVGTGSTQLFDSGTAVGTFFVQNLGPNDITFTDAAGTTNSIVVPANGGSVTLDRVNGKGYAKCPVAQVAPLNTRILGDTD